MHEPHIRGRAWPYADSRHALGCQCETCWLEAYWQPRVTAWAAERMATESDAAADALRAVHLHTLSCPICFPAPGRHHDYELCQAGAKLFDDYARKVSSL